MGCSAGVGPVDRSLVLVWGLDWLQLIRKQGNRFAESDSKNSCPHCNKVEFHALKQKRRPLFASKQVAERLNFSRANDVLPPSNVGHQPIDIMLTTGKRSAYDHLIYSVA